MSVTASRVERECPNRRYVFERHPRKKLKLPAMDLKQVMSTNRSDCEDRSVRTVHSCLTFWRWSFTFNPLKRELNPVCYLLVLLAHHFLHVSRIRVKSLTIRLLMSYIYGAPILDVSRSHTTTQHSR